jgi:preprotein translocase subunit YajC
MDRTDFHGAIIPMLMSFEYNATIFFTLRISMEILTQILPFVFLIAIMYFVIIRPQSQQAKKHKEMVETLTKGDKIVTSGGLIVEIKKVEEQFFTVKFNNDTEGQLVKDAVARKYGDEA